MTPDVIKEKLKNGIIKFVYTKKDGKEREATGTTNVNVLNENNVNPKGKQIDENPDIIRYYDIDKAAWRSFNIINFVKIIEN